VLKDRVRIVHELTKDLPDLAELHNAKTGLRSFPSLVSPQRVEVTAQPTAESITSDKSPSNHATEQQTLAALSNGTIRVQAILPRTDQIIELLSHARDAHLVQNVITTDEYSLGRFSKLQVDRVIDVGAHVGSATAYFLARYPRARVHAFEPNTTTFDLLSRNLGHDGRVTLHHAGWAGAGRRAELFEGERLSMASSVYTHANSAESSHTIELLDAAEAFDQSTSGTATILKIDTEGCELEILHRLGERLHRCDVIMLEYHSESDRRAIDAFLATTGFIMFGSLATQPHRGTLKFIRAELASSFDDGRHAGKPIEHHSQE
jgi:FkbM family methyltransferase